MCENKTGINLSGHNLSGITEISHCLNTTDQNKIFGAKQDNTMVVCPVLTPDRAEKRQNGRRFKDDGEPSFTLTAQDIHGVAVEVREATKQGYALAHPGDSINLAMPESKTRRGRVGGGNGSDVGHKLQSWSDGNSDGEYP